jgi:transposase
MNKINSETEKRIAKMYRNGFSMCKIAKEFSVTPATVYLHLRKFIPKEERQRRQHVASFTESDAKKFCSLYKKGMSSVEIGRKFKIETNSVLYALKKHGIDTSKKGKYNPKVDSSKLSIMKKIYKNTGSVLETANQMDLHPSSVHYRLSKEGLVKKKALNQKVIKMKYEKLTNVLKELFEKMGLELEHVQERYNGHGPDMIVRDGNKRILVEHKATVKRSFYWKHGIEEAKTHEGVFKADVCWIITTATKPNNIEKMDGMELIFFEDLKKLLISNDLSNLIHDIEFISNTPSV